ncbi:hypothetical protein EZV62_004581 [Acer yangbiense]|uniref:HAT C-terminal dimerisation domain-containing protein n=1 Tax=Acer yangbiense TaxID=1000413 RepID=A0A5C7IMF1_9ROSI|nr:hypothetical protein EZV62_004581 [Acer yangbiense]
MKVMECYFPSLYGNGSSDEIIKIQEVLLRMVGKYDKKSKASQASNNSLSNPTYVSPSQSIMGPPKKKMSQFDQYITECIARDILNIPVSTVAFESAFSASGINNHIVKNLSDATLKVERKRMMNVIDDH